MGLLLAEVKFREGGIRKISCVLKPAIQSDFLLFSDETIELAINEDKHIITGPVLIPDKHYYRNSDFFKKALGVDNNDGGEIYFSKQTVTDLAKDYLKNANNSFNINHSVDIDNNDIHLLESWIVNTPNDKIYDLGFSKDKITQGSWCMSEYINTNTPTGLQLWQDFKDKKLRGYSIQGNPAIELVKDIKMNEDDAIADTIANTIAELAKGF